MRRRRWGVGDPTFLSAEGEGGLGLGWDCPDVLETIFICLYQMLSEGIYLTLFNYKKKFGLQSPELAPPPTNRPQHSLKSLVCRLEAALLAPLRCCWKSGDYELQEFLRSHTFTQKKLGNSCIF